MEWRAVRSGPECKTSSLETRHPNTDQHSPRNRTELACPPENLLGRLGHSVLPGPLSCILDAASPARKGSAPASPSRWVHVMHLKCSKAKPNTTSLESGWFPPTLTRHCKRQAGATHPQALAEGASQLPGDKWNWKASRETEIRITGFSRHSK